MNEYPLINREYSWLEFNDRVLYEAFEADNPVLERIKFLSITASNLEEFFMVRVAALKNKKRAKINDNESNLSRSPAEQLKTIRLKANEMINKQYALFYQEIIPELNKIGIKLLLKQDEIIPIKNNLLPFFENELKPSLTPLSIGPTQPFITLVTGRLYIAAGLNPLSANPDIEKSRLSFLEIPTNVFGRFYQPENDKNCFIPLENIIRLFANQIYKGYEVTSCHVIKITRDADLSLQEEDAPDLLKEIESSIKRMHRRSAVKLEYEKDTPSFILKTLLEKNIINEEDIYSIDGILNLKDLMLLYEIIDNEKLKYRPVTPVYPRILKNKNIFNVIKNNDVLLFHPYHSYDPVVELICQAADDPEVIAIKQTLYRTSPLSEIIPALIRAAENGKYVTVIDELKARFDEKRNIEWARKLEDAGAHVTYGVAGYKTHAKALLIIRKEKSRLKRYVHLATGNYNEITARLYSDFSFFSSNDKTAEDISSLFNLLTGFSLAEKWNEITLAPVDLRMKFLRLIDREKENAKNGLKAKITAKMNSLSDIEIIRHLYEASQAGVKISLIVRGICSLVPGIKNLSDNISIVSLIGRYLEHSRIYYFYNNGEDEYYLSSADWMERNLDRRIEILFPVKDENNGSFIKKILDLQFEDCTNLWELRDDQSYRLVKGKTKRKAPDSFENIYQLIKKKEAGIDARVEKTFKPIKKTDENG